MNKLGARLKGFQQIANYLDVSETTVQDLVFSKQLSAYKLLGSWICDTAICDEYVKENTEKGRLELGFRIAKDAARSQLKKDARIARARRKAEEAAEGKEIPRQGLLNCDRYAITATFGPERKLWLMTHKELGLTPSQVLCDLVDEAMKKQKEE